MPPGSEPFWSRCLGALALTVQYALIAMSMAVPSALVFGFFASRAWWPSWPEGRPPTVSLRLLRYVLTGLFVVTRVLIAFLRSIHELLWAILFLAAIGDFPFVACVALALPFGGTLAKVFAEIIDETPQNARNTLSASGARAPQAFLAALIPRALPDLITYTLYRLECAVRSAAVLGFIGIETIGLYINWSFENFYFGEVWTELYLLLATIIAIEAWGVALRKRLNRPADSHIKPNLDGKSTPDKVTELRKARPRSKFLRFSLIGVIVAVVGSWSLALYDDDRPFFGDASWERRSKNLDRFLNKLVPKPVRESGEWSDAGPWLEDLWENKGKEASVTTVAISVVAILLSAACTLLLIPLASRVLTRARPFDLAGRAPPLIIEFFWSALGWLVRIIFILTRAIPEYIYAFFLLFILGPTPMALVYALAIHNLGILGRLWGEVVENAPDSTARHLASRGARRAQIFTIAIFPSIFGRMVLYLFYRWETCVREAVVLGFLGLATLGFHIQEARAFFKYDTMLVFVLIGATIIIIGDLTSDLLRRWIRKV